jgi:hypothetical protein
MVKPFVFISHASDDNLRIVPILLELQQKHGILCWFDRPDDVSPVYEEFRTYGQIQAGEAWPDAIQNALEGCSCVLVFWSNHANAARKYVVDEAEKGLTDDKLVQVELDPGAMRKCDRIYGRFQPIASHACLHERAIENIAKAVKKKMEEAECRRLEARRMQDQALIPYIINRHSQINDLRADLFTLFKQKPSATACLKPVYISRGLSKDCPEFLFERFEAIDGPTICKHFERTYGPHEGGVNSGWPTDDQARPADVARRIRAMIGGHCEYMSGPCLARSVVKALRKNEADYVSEWFSAWDNAYTENADLLFIPVLDLRLDGIDSRWRLGGGKRVLTRIYDVVGEWSKRANQRKSRVEPVKLDQLEQVSRDDAYSWAWRHYGEGENRVKANQFVRNLFSTAKTRLYMDDFVRAVEAKLFREITQEGL